MKKTVNRFFLAPFRSIALEGVFVKQSFHNFIFKHGFIGSSSYICPLPTVHFVLLQTRCTVLLDAWYAAIIHPSTT